ncbi:MAG: pyruvate, phosphate dikinase, partial [Phycisphaerales bacterium]
MVKYVYSFGDRKAEGSGQDRDLLGGKGAGLAEMTRIGLPVPAGMTITTECCHHYHTHGKQWPKTLRKQILEAGRKLERTCGKRFGDPRNPLLVSVRSGAARSMPGMMETILNLGLNDQCVEGLAKASGDRRFALDAYRRLIMMYGSTAMGIPRERFDEAFARLKDERTRRRLSWRGGAPITDTEVDADELAELVERFKAIYQRETGKPFPQDPFEQFFGAINAIFESWMQDKAVTYRRVEKITGLKGTAVNVQQMVFGNMGNDSGTGVCFTRDPSTGENVLYGELLMNAQGEDVVAGIRTPIPLVELDRIMPKVALQLQAVRALLELHYRDMQDIEFTIE